MQVELNNLEMEQEANELLSQFQEISGNGVELQGNGLNGNGFSDGYGNGYNMDNLMKNIKL